MSTIDQNVTGDNQEPKGNKDDDRMGKCDNYGIFNDFFIFVKFIFWSYVYLNCFVCL